MKKAKNVIFISQVLLFNVPDEFGTVIKKEAINVGELEQMKIKGDLVSYEIDDNCLKIKKKINHVSEFVIPQSVIIKKIRK